MPYDLRWHDEEKTIFWVDIFSPVSWGEWHATLDALVEMLESADHRIDIIFNNTAGMPPGNPLPHFKTSMVKLGAAPNLKVMVIVSNRAVSTFIKSLINLVIRAMPITWNPTTEFAMTGDEALKIIANDRTKQDIAA